MVILSIAVIVVTAVIAVIRAILYKVVHMSDVTDDLPCGIFRFSLEYI